MTKQISEIFKKMLQIPDLASKKWVCEQYDSGVMNDTIQIGGDASITRVHGTNKALATTSDCTPRYVEADPFIGAQQAVVETYRNISAVGAKPLAITNCLNFGNPQKPEIMGQIVRAIKGITEACEFLQYPVVSGNVSLYNETDGKAIQPTPSIGGVGLLKDLQKRSNHKFKNIGDSVFIIGDNAGYIGSSLFEREILGIENQNPPPPINLELEKKHGEAVRELISNSTINACHDISDGGLLVALFEMCNNDLGVDVNLDKLNLSQKDIAHILFGEDQARYIVAVDQDQIDNLIKFAQGQEVQIAEIGKVIADNITLNDQIIAVKDLVNLNESVFINKFA